MPEPEVVPAPRVSRRSRESVLAGAGVLAVVAVAVADSGVVGRTTSAPAPVPSGVPSAPPSPGPTSPAPSPSGAPSDVPVPSTGPTPSTGPSPSSGPVSSAPSGPAPGPSAPSTAPAPTPAPGTAPCSPDGTRVLRGTQDAAAGLRLDSVVLEVCGDAPVALEGYPEVVLLDGAGRALDVEVEQGEAQGAGDLDPGPVPLLLAPGERAVAVLTWRGTVVDGAGSSTGAAVVVTPRPGDEPLPPLAMDVDLGTTGLLSVTAWQGWSGPA